MNNRLPHISLGQKSVLKPSPKTQQRPTATETPSGAGDSFIPTEARMGGLDSPLFVDGKLTTKRELVAEGKADPVTYAPIVEKSAEAKPAPTPESKPTHEDPPGIMGGLDSPLFIDGEITTKRQLIEEGKADPVTRVAY